MSQNSMHARTYLIIAGMVGLLMAIVVTVRLSLPTMPLLGQLSQFSLPIRTAIIARLLSPLLSFVLIGGWIWVLLSLGEQFFFSHENKEHAILATPSSETTHQHPQYTEEQFVTPHTNHPEPLTIQKRIAVPPLFQLDPTDPWQQGNLPTTPLPITNPGWSANVNRTEEETKNENDEHTGAPPPEQAQPPQTLNTPSQQEEQQQTEEPKEAQPLFSLQLPKQSDSTPTPVTLTLLKQIRCWIQADDGTQVEVKLRKGENAIRLIQLAYIAWRRGNAVDRDKVLTYAVARGKRRDMNVDQLGEVFDAAKRYLRQDLDRAVKDLEKNGHPVTGNIDFFSNEPGFYSLHPSCRAIDLDEIEEHDNTIKVARKEGLLDEKLDGTMPDWVIQACQKLIDAYPGDFIQSLLEKFPEEFGPWAKEPVTLYRDKYLDALLIMANHESALGRNVFDNKLSTEQNEEQRRHHIGRAAQLFYDYAMYAINTRWDKKVKFAYRADKDGERVIRAARAMRRCVVELGMLGNPDMIDQVYLAFKERMSTLSEGTWKPDKDTENDVAEAKKTTNAYRFSLQLSSQQQGQVQARSKGATNESLSTPHRTP
ncbi:hypothetical protein [Dictyobacter formicarum]|uniref:Bacterial transcriptional activator domain-containing protein n=1 Tax=Dictyobacter formicarum TaxID=2778368 RepID=A0ABQ3V989_9CHLR|nr:hypothetical protein [Dictyobacter formicarum]GHO82350.1 hypothetical protein KSZ_03560 [Dictyobacter formicarum]